MTTLTYRQLVTIQAVLKEAKLEALNVCVEQDNKLRALIADKASQDKIDVEAEIQDKNWDAKTAIDNAFYAIKELADAF